MSIDIKEQVLNVHYKKVGIMGGTFDPIHYGHLAAASFAKQEFNLDKVIFIPNGKAYYKNNVSSAKHRYNMTLLATVENKDFLISSLEIDREGDTYTIDTIKYIKDIFKDTEIYFISGTDSISKMYTWKQAKELAKICKFIAVTRQGYTLNKEDECNLNKINANIVYMKIPNLDISSSDIRNKIKDKKDVSYLLPKSVKQYISKFNLYSDFNYEEKYKHLIDKLKENLNNARFAHSLEVAKEAVKLANNYSLDSEKAFIAGLLHDCAKCISSEDKLKLCKKYNIELDDSMLSNIDLTHSFLGYFIAREDYNIIDEEILTAIKYHTTGSPNMTSLEKIVYIADYIEPTRKYFEEQKLARMLAYENLDDAMKYILKSTIDFNLKQNRLIHQLSIDALNFYEMKEKK